MSYERKVFGNRVRAIRVTDTEDTYEHCKECGKVIPPGPTIRVRVFCGSPCGNRYRTRKQRERLA